MAAAALPVEVELFLEQEAHKELLRFSTAGSVDDGKSTLIGRLLYDSKGVYEDQIASVRKASVNRSAGPIDFSLLTDGLRAEREQGITIDVAYRYFATPRRKFIIADTPGHEQYTRNMATGASTADLAIVLVDARKGVLPQSRRHAYIAALLGIPYVAVAVNKMDLVGFDQGVFESIKAEFSRFVEPLSIPHLFFLPISALEGDNVVARSARTPWYDGPSLLTLLETVPLPRTAAEGPLRFPVQLVLRPDLDFRGYAGQLASGQVRPGDEVLVLPSGRRSQVVSIPTLDGDLPLAFAPQSVALRLRDEIDISRGDMLVSPGDPPAVARRIEAKLVWMHADPLQVGRPYLLKHTTQQVRATVAAVRHRVDIHALQEMTADRLELNEIGSVTIDAARALFVDPYRKNRRTGSFILIDPLSNATVAAGMIESVVADTSWRPVQESERTARYGHGAALLLLPGRRELAERVERVLFDRGGGACVVAQASRETLEVLLGAGLVVIATGEQEAVTGGPVIRTKGLPEDDEAAVRGVLDALARAGLIRGSEASEGEGI